ncbi:MAG: transcription elongation factor GreA [Lachnospiraceae bacterium]|nr:transcription elongation factor GreA [Lachnospiraceae bacterium]
MAEQLTKSDIKKIQAEIDDRILVQRPKLIADLKEARAQGDLSENFEYYAAKRAKNQNESRIRYLENMLKNAIEVDDTTTAGVVSLNDTVTFYIPEDDFEETVKIVTSIRGNSLRGKISNESPVGKALLGHKVGDTCTVEVPGSENYEIQITALDQSSNDEEDTIRKF